MSDMSIESLNRIYEGILADKDEIIKKISILKQNDVVKEYLDLCDECDGLTDAQRILYKQIKKAEYSSCNHIWITTQNKYDDSEGRMYRYRGCIKCGLDTRVRQYSHRYIKRLSFDQQIMYEFIMNNFINRGIDTNLLCDLELAKAIYSKIKEIHPNIDDEIAKKYFEVALDDIRNIKVNEERKVSRAKRLSLSNNFNRWN